MTNDIRAEVTEAITDDEYDDICKTCRAKCESCGAPVDALDTAFVEDLRRLASTTYDELTATTVKLLF